MFTSYLIHFEQVCIFFIRSLYKVFCRFALCLHHTWICSCLDIVAEWPVYCGSTVVSGGKVKRIDQFLLSPKLFGLADVFMHKAQFWSFDNYMKRVLEDARLSFLDHVERTHKENRDDHEGTSALHARGILFESDAAIICLTCVIRRDLDELGCQDPGG